MDLVSFGFSLRRRDRRQKKKETPLLFPTSPTSTSFDRFDFLRTVRENKIIPSPASPSALPFDLRLAGKTRGACTSLFSSHLSALSSLPNSNTRRRQTFFFHGGWSRGFFFLPPPLPLGVDEETFRFQFFFSPQSHGISVYRLAGA